MDRETQNIKIGTNEFIVKSYATAREANAIQQAYFKGTKMEVVGEQPKISEFNPGVQFEVSQEMIAQMVISVNGTGEATIDRCLDLPNTEFNELIAALDAIVSKKKS